MSRRNPPDLERGLGLLASEEGGDAHRRATLAGVRGRVDRQDRDRRRWRRTGASGGIFVLVAACLLLIPWSYDVTVGSRVSVSWTSPDMAGSEELTARLRALDGLLLPSVRNEDDRWTVDLSFQDPDLDGVLAAVGAGVAESGLEGVAIDGQPIVQRVGGNVLAAVTGGWLRISIRGLQRDEAEAHLVRELEAWGARDVKVRITYPDDPGGEPDRIKYDFFYRDPPESTVTIEIEH